MPFESFSEDSQSSVLLEGMYPYFIFHIFSEMWITCNTVMRLKDKPRKGLFFFFLVESYCSIDKIIIAIEQHLHSLQIATQADLGLADAYINGDFSLVDKDEGLQNLFMVTQLT